MLTLEQLNALRGISTVAGKKSASSENANELQNPNQNSSAPVSPSPVYPPSSEQPQQTKNNYIPPVEIPCKNYADEKGHFAYIDANTHQISHVNLDTGKVYTMEDVYYLSLKHAVEPLSPEYQVLVWQQVLNDDTIFDRFGSPVFSFEEIYNARNKSLASVNKAVSENENTPKTDAFGFPL